jgi:hypothetical protein
MGEDRGPREGGRERRGDREADAGEIPQEEPPPALSEAEQSAGEPVGATGEPGEDAGEPA